MTDDAIEQATEALIAALEAARQRLPPYGRGGHAAGQRLLAAARNARHLIGQRFTFPLDREHTRQSGNSAQSRNAAARREAKWVAERQQKRAAPAAHLASLKADLFKAHPDHGGSANAFRKAFKRYDSAKRAR